MSNPEGEILTCRHEGPSRERMGRHLIIDGQGIVVAWVPDLTAYRSPDALRQLAAVLAAGPALLAAAREARPHLQADLKATIESHCLLDPGTLEPDLSTLDDVAKPAVTALTAALERLDTAIAAAEGAA